MLIIPVEDPIAKKSITIDSSSIIDTYSSIVHTDDLDKIDESSRYSYPVIFTPIRLLIVGIYDS